jgi:hypothetical protein
MSRIIGFQITPGLPPLNGPITLADAQASPATAVSYAIASYSYVQWIYSLVRDGETSTGQLLITTDGTNASLSGASTDISDLGITFSASVSSGSLNIQYTTTSTGFTSQLKYYEYKWD